MYMYICILVIFLAKPPRQQTIKLCLLQPQAPTLFAVIAKFLVGRFLQVVIRMVGRVLFVLLRTTSLFMVWFFLF